jgi:hypothetical protein
MSKIEKYREQDRITTKIITDLNKAQGFNAIGSQKDPNNDKHGIGFYKNQIWDTDIPVWLHASYGYYGSSDGYTACSPELQPYLIKALNHYKMDIVNFIVEQVEHDKHKALYECKEEAERILKEIDSIMINKAE